jgi:O-methyltransferase
MCRDLVEEGVMFRRLLSKLVPNALKANIRALIRSSTPRSEADTCISLAVRFVCWNQIPGDYLEFGCYSGWTLAHAFDQYQSTRKAVSDRLSPDDRNAFDREKPRFFAFDSFEGLPQPRNADHHPYLPKHWKGRGFAMSQQEFENAIRSRGVDMDDVRVVRGWYQDTLVTETKERHKLSRASIVHIDCDYYESAIVALKFVTNLVGDGTVIIFDDYNYFRGSPGLGERKAFAEWLSLNPDIRATELARQDFDKVAFFLSMKGTG